MTVNPDLLDDLVARGLVHDTTDRDALAARLREGPVTVYVGFDPTADSLHVGNLIGLLMLRRFQDAGHRPISLAGGATGMVGDPSGKSDERALLDDDALAANLAGIVPQLRQFIDFDRSSNPAKLLDNRAWTVGVPYLVFLRDVGKHITVNQMLAKDSVKSRLGTDDGISYTEFSYMLLQANDFAWLHEHEGCEMQMGGSDQWGNITAGTELIRKRGGGSAYALTWPLLTKPDGSKYGKTAGGETMWLSAERMSPYRFYQGWLNVDDGEVEKLLLQLTLLPVDEIRSIVTDHRERPHERGGQRRLAKELTTLVHGEEATAAAEAASAVVFGGTDAASIGADVLEVLVGELPGATLDHALLSEPDNVATVMAAGGVTASKGEAVRLVGQRGLSVNDRKLEPGATIAASDLLHDRHLLVRRGKRHVHLLSFARNPPGVDGPSGPAAAGPSESAANS